MAESPVLVIGAGGQLARALARHRELDSHPIVCRGRPDIDLSDPPALQRFCAELSPVAVVNAGAYNAVDAAEKDAATAFAVNADGPGELARLCENRQIPLVHVSTDYVFDGMSRTPYKESDLVAPLGVYGLSKARGEEAVRERCTRHVILRTAWLYGTDASNFLTTMLHLGAEREELRMVDDQYSAPTWSADVARAIISILLGCSGGQRKAWGTYHLTGGGMATRYSFASEIFRLAAMAGRKVPCLSPISSTEYGAPARRPAYSVLDNQKIKTTFDIRLPAWQDSLAQCMGQFFTHEDYKE